MKSLRDKKKITKFLILYHSAVDEPSRLADIADELEMTEQGVSNYISEMHREGLIDPSSYAPTPDGMEFVRETLSELANFLDSANKEIELINRCTAIADESIEEGDQVGLFMKDGFLHASTEESSSNGIALSHAEEGQPIMVGALRGITELEVGTVYMVKVGIERGIDKGMDRLEKKLEKIDYDRLAVMDEEQYGLASSAGYGIDITFSPIESAISAVEKGLDVAFLVSEDECEGIVESLKRHNKAVDREYRIEFRVI